jgi:hypothetical protein
MCGSSPLTFVQVSKSFVSAQFRQMTEEAEANPQMAAAYGLRRIYDEYISTPATESLIFRRAEAIRAAEGGISHAELGRRMPEGGPLGFWIFMRRSGGEYVIVDTLQTVGCDYY